MFRLLPIYMNMQSLSKTPCMVSVFCQGLKNEGTFVPSPLKMRGHLFCPITSKNEGKFSKP